MKTISKIMTSAFTILLFGIYGVGCASTKAEILEYENVSQYKLQLNPHTKVPEQISGTCFKSAYDVIGVTTRTNGNALVVLVEISLFKGRTGGFSYPLKLADKIKELRFGMKEHVLWKRDSGVQLNSTRQP